MHELAIDIGNRLGSINVIDAVHITSTNAAVDLNRVIRDRIANKKRFYGIEVSPVPSTEALNFNGFEVVPVFTSITWLLDHNLRQTTLGEAPALKLAAIIRNSTPVLSHLTCYQMTENQLSEILLEHHVDNVLALRGDLRTKEQPWQHAIDLVRAIRAIKPTVTIAVAGYPEVHSEAVSRDIDLKFLKEKVDAGANLIVTNVCFSFAALADFIRSCRALGITVPIVPGIFTPSSYTSLVQMCRICKMTVPETQMQQYRALKNNAEQFKQFAVTCTEQLLDQLFHFEFEQIYGVHFFTLNKYDGLNDILKKYQFE